MFKLFKKRSDVIGSINISQEGILIESKRIHISGKTTFDNDSIPDSAMSRMLMDRINELENEVKYLSDVTMEQQVVYDTRKALETAEQARDYALKALDKR
ncbi:hypothetical protein LABALGNA3A7_09660 [Dellaglioa algida]|nr:hypothetical protein LABALGNA3A7_09660 [Dellaglioa algida]